MEDQKVSFKVAILAKKIDFNIGVNNYFTLYKVNKIDPEYPEGGGPFSMIKDKIESSNGYIVNGNKEMGDFSNENYDMFARPTQSLLQKYIREKYGIDVIPYPSAVLKKKYIYLILSDNLELIEESDEKYDSYEEAFEEGLIKTCLLIINNREIYE